MEEGKGREAKRALLYFIQIKEKGEAFVTNRNILRDLLLGKTSMF